MDIRPSNPCIRCGKERKVVKTWKENSGNSVLTYTTMVCPDAKCQEIVDRKLAALREKREATERDREQRRAFAKNITRTGINLKKI